MILRISITLTLFVATAVGQRLPEFSVFCLDCRRTISYAAESDGLPKIIRAKGVIKDAAGGGTLCGDLATAGSIRVKLDQRPDGFKSDNLYVVVLCLAPLTKEKLVGKRVDFEAQKMTSYPYSFDVLLSALDSLGEPFYLAKLEGKSLVTGHK